MKIVTSPFITYASMAELIVKIAKDNNIKLLKVKWLKWARFVCICNNTAPINSYMRSHFLLNIYIMFYPLLFIIESSLDSG